MNKRSLLTISLVMGLALAVVVLFTASAMAQGAKPAGPAAPEVWPGTWQMGPTLDAGTFGCSAGDGLARFTGQYYSDTNRIYFLGGRCENNNTTGAVFYFDMASRTYAAAGRTMGIPVSNYQAATIDDDGQGNGPGLYIVGGRTNSGGQTNAVQVYYPGINLTATITTDPFPPAVLYSPGGVAAANGKLYVFGGFDGANMYATTYIYDPAAVAGSRWTTSTCNLPTARSYIATTVIGNKIYAIGGDELPALTPINDTVVLDTNNLAACWQDAAMADLPQANGDAPAVYVDEGYLGSPGGAIFVVGGYWPVPGPYRWVFRYDVVADTWESFPDLAIPAPATGRRNQAAVYVPASASTLGLGNGVPGIWTFGGYDGSNTNAMAGSSEFFSYKSGPVLVLPEQLQVAGVGGSTATHHFILVNQSGGTHTFDLSYTSNVTWTATLPSSVGPVADGAQITFTMGVAIPASQPCPSTSAFTVTAVAQGSPVISDSQPVSVRVVCGIAGVLHDANTGAPLANAYVWIQDTPAGLNVYYDAHTNASGEYVIADVAPGTYYWGASARYFQPSFYPTGWPTGAITFTLAGNSAVINRDMVGSQMDWTPTSLSVTLPADSQLAQTMIITNSGTGPLAFTINEVSPSAGSPPPAEGRESTPPRIDPQLYTDLASNSTADFVVVLKGEANLDAAYSMTDWNARGQYVLDTLKAYAEQSQRGLRSFLDGQKAAYEPLYIINGVIVKGGNMAMVNSLAARSDVAYVRANHRIPVEHNLPDLISQHYATVQPDTIEWNITKVGAPGVWALGYKGQGTVVAEIDTGTQYDHPALYRQYRGWLGGTNYDHNYNWFDPYHQCPNNGATPCDPGDHGTHVMGTMVGEDATQTNQIGMAPGAKWISCKGGDEVSGYLLTDELLQCAQWILAPTDLNEQNPDPTKRPNVVNNSWGGGNGDYWYTGAVSAWRAAGIFPAFSNGNSGPGCSTAGSPGDNWNTFASGATDINDAIAGFSSRGPAKYFGILKPDISSPGVNIRSSVPGSIYAGGWSGTSMASPHTAGAVALLWSADPELVGQVDLTGWILEKNALPLTTNEGCGGDTPTSVPNNTFGYGRLNILAAVNAALSGDDTLPWLVVDPSGGAIGPGSVAPVNVTFHAPGTSGTYTGTLWLVADDPYNHDVRLPVTLVVKDAAPTASFTSSSPTFFGDITAFTNTSIGSVPMQFYWSFGDDITSTLENPTHTYGSLGTFTVTLLVTNSLGSDTATGTVMVVDVPPVASFEVSAASANVGDTLVFTNTSTGTHLEFLWNFGDGVTSTLKDPTHVYAVSGIYTVTLTASNSAGSSEASDELAISGPPVADFVSSSPDLVGQTTYFTDTSHGYPPVTTRSWTFESGQVGAGPNPTHTFSAAGLYSVTLLALNAEGNDTYTGLVAICNAYVSGASFTTDPAAPLAGQTVAFEGSVAAGDEFPSHPVTYAWDFGDGGLATGITATHAFTPAGVYTVTLTATGPCGQDTYIHALDVTTSAPQHLIYLPIILKNS